MEEERLSIEVMNIVSYRKKEENKTDEELLGRMEFVE